MTTDAANKLSELVDIIQSLRDPDTGCPWDREQTHRSLRPYVIEEAYEVAAAIEDDPDSLLDELGDLLLQILLHAQIASEENRFDLTSVMSGLADKLIRRHPHVFGDAKADTAEEVKTHWEAIKKKEKGDVRAGILDSLPKNFPANLEAYKIGKKVARVNFDWDTPDQIKEKLLEELEELGVAQSSPKPNEQEIEEELGDLLFTTAQLARKLGVEPEEALKAANRKFRRRFQAVEELATTPLAEIPRAELEALWKKVKDQES